MLYQQKSDRDPNPYLNFLSKLPPEEEEPEGLISGTEFEMELLGTFWKLESTAKKNILKSNSSI